MTSKLPEWLRGKRGGLLAFLVIVTLLAGGLGWVTSAVLGLEQEQYEARVQAQLHSQLRLALWKLDSLVGPVLARESSRPYNHFSAVFAVPLAFKKDGSRWPAGQILEPSPLLSAELPDWMLLHFQTDYFSGWTSPQVLSANLELKLRSGPLRDALVNVTPGRGRLLAQLNNHGPSETLRELRANASLQPTLEDTTLLPGSNNQIMANNPAAGKPENQQNFDPDLLTRAGQQMQLRSQNRAVPQRADPDIDYQNLIHNGEDWFSGTPLTQRIGQPVDVTLGPLAPLWLDTSAAHAGVAGSSPLVVARRVQIGNKEVCQGILLDWPRLAQVLAEEVKDTFPEARIVPVDEDSAASTERILASLPVLQLDPGPTVDRAMVVGWTALRVGLALAWAAALLALTAVALGGWSLIDLSQRRIRFVSAVTHELRTPLTTLRLYLDMLTGGLVREETQKQEYLQTLHCEADRLNRLVSNVLDFSRMENQRPQLIRTEFKPADLLEEVRAAWQSRCVSTGKELVVEIEVPPHVRVSTDARLVQQVLGNLIDNACKYTRDVADRRLWLRVRCNHDRHLVFEVEDRGPGIPARERRMIFRPFRRGQHVETIAGGVGLGLALARRWASLLDGRLSLQTGTSGQGTCFRLEIPL